jgi:hypothetical protein
MFHIALHFLIPALIAYLVFRNKWHQPFFIMIATMLVDLDHLVANPIYDPLRCSIGFHPLHQNIAIGLYLIMCFVPKVRWVGIGLLIHMALDSIDCYVNQGVLFNTNLI